MVKLCRRCPPYDAHREEECMDPLIKALLPVFVAGFAVQRVLELLDPLLVRLALDDSWKKFVLGLVSLGLGLTAAFAGGLRVLQPLGAAGTVALDALLTALI